MIPMFSTFPRSGGVAMEELTGEFEAISDSGARVRVSIYTRFSEIALRGSGKPRLPGAIILKLADGTLVNRVGKGEYRIFASSELLRSTEPNAP
jgi:hypothetical protein